MTGDGDEGRGTRDEIGFFARAALPAPMNPRVQHGIEDAFAGRRGVLHIFEAE